MKEKIALVFIVLALSVSGTLSGATAQAGQTSDPGVKIAFVNTLVILQNTAEGKQQLSSIESFVNEKQKAIQTQSSELQALQQQYESQARMLNPDTAAEMQSQIAQKERALRRLQEDVELDVNRRRNEMLNRMSEKIQGVIAEYAEQNGFGAVFLQNPSLPYFAPTLDITAAIVQIYDQKYPVAGGTTPSTPTAQNP